MSMCDRCIHSEVCGLEDNHEEALTYCRDFLGWVPGGERLPDIHNCIESYLVTLKRGGIHIALFTECNGKHWWTYDDVVAWMPLPTPYEPQESEIVT